MNQSIETYRQYALPIRHTIAQNLPYKVSVQSLDLLQSLLVQSLLVQSLLVQSIRTKHYGILFTSNIEFLAISLHNMLKSILASLSLFTPIAVAKYDAHDGFLELYILRFWHSMLQ